MNLIRWTPQKNLNNFRHEFEDLFNSYGLDKFFKNDEERLASTWSPAIDVLENKDNYVIEAELPGIDKKDVKIDITDDLLTIKGEKQTSKNQDSNNYYCTERVYGSFYRSFKLPNNVDGQNIKAEYKNGILKLSIPKTEAAKPKTIEIQ